MNILDQFSLQGKVALITGGAGIYGRQLVTALAEAGAETFVAARSLDKLEVLAKEHQEKGLDVTALQYDQASEASILALRDAIVEKTGTLDVLVNNSVLRPMKQGYRDAAETFAESMQVNATGLFMITRAMGDVMAEHLSSTLGS